MIATVTLLMKMKYTNTWIHTKQLVQHQYYYAWYHYVNEDINNLKFYVNNNLGIVNCNVVTSTFFFKTLSGSTTRYEESRHSANNYFELLSTQLCFYDLKNQWITCRINLPFYKWYQWTTFDRSTKKRTEDKIFLISRVRVV